jgi:hypothetical protein
MRRRQLLPLRKQQSESVQPVEQIVVKAEYAPGQCPLCGHEIAPPSLPGIGAEAGSEAHPESPAPQPGITYLHDEHTKVTLPCGDFDPGKVQLRDMNDFPQKLDAAVERARPKRGRRKGA